MPEVYRETRTYRERDDGSSDDEKYNKSTTVRRYKVGGGSRVERVERERVEEIDDDRRSRYSTLGVGRTSQGDLLEVDRRVERTYLPERPRSAFEANPRTTTVVERKVIERDRDRDRDRDDYDRDYRDDRQRSTYVERQVIERERDDDRYGDDRERSRMLVYEKTKEVERRDDREPLSPRDWDRHSRGGWDRDDAEVRIEKRVERREDGDVRVEKRIEERRDDAYGGEVERYRKETEYYEPAQGPIVIRQRAPEQKIIVQEAAAPPPLVIRETQESRELARRNPREEEFYYRRDSREVGPYRGDRRDEEYAVARYDRGPRYYDRSDRGDRGRRYSDGEDDDGYYVKRTIVRRERDRSGSPNHHKLHLAEGALAGAGISALVSSRRDANGELPEHRGRKVLAGAALGALGTEVLKRAHSAYNERFGDDDRSRSRSRSRDRHSKLKAGLGIAAAALAVAGAAKYMQTQRQEKEEMTRGRSRSLRRYSNDGVSRSPSQKRSRSRAASIAKAAVGTAAVAGLVKHFRDKSKGRSRSKSRSHSHLRTGAEIVAAGLAGAAGKKLWDRHQEKKDRARHADEDEEYEHEQDRDRSRSRSRSASRPMYPEPGAADPELGMVEYGGQPLYTEPAYPGYGYGAAPGAAAGGAAGYESAAEEERRRHRHRHRHGSKDDYSSDADSEADKGKPKKKRSRSTLRDMAAAAVGAGATAIGLKKYQDSQKKKEKDKDRDREERSRDRERDHDRGHDRGHDRDRERERDRRRYEDETSTDGYNEDAGYGGHRTPSPPHASGGAYYPPPPGAAGFTAHPNVATTDLSHGYQAYNPGDYAGYPPPGPDTPTGPPPNSAAPNPGVPPGHPLGPDHVSEASRSPPAPTPASNDADATLSTGGNKDGVNPAPSRSRPAPLSLVTAAATASEAAQARPATPGTAKSVTFIPLSPQSSRTLRRHHREQGEHHDHRESDGPLDADSPDMRITPHLAFPQASSSSSGRPRRNSDPSSDRPLVPRWRPGHDDGGSLVDDGEEVIEVLPDRFDSRGRPIDSHGTRIDTGRGWHTRRGEFEYHPRGNNGGGGGWNVQGQWGVAGTDREAVERIVRDVTGVLEGRGSWLGLVGRVLGGGLLGGVGGASAEGDGGGDETGHGRRGRDGGEGSGGSAGRKLDAGGGERRRIEGGRDDDDGNNGHRRRRRRRDNGE